MSTNNDCLKWIVFYKWKGNFYKKTIVAKNEQEAEDKAVNKLIEEGRGTDCLLVAIVPELDDYILL